MSLEVTKLVKREIKYCFNPNNNTKFRVIIYFTFKIVGTIFFNI